MRKSIALAVTAVATTGLVGLAPVAANAACGDGLTDVCSGTTTVTATVGAVGIMSIVTTPAATLTSTTSPATGSLGLTTVTDTNTGNHTWAVDIKSTDFSLVGATGTTIAASKATVSMAAPTVAIPGTATISSYPAAASPLTLSNTDQGLVSASAANANTVTYTPSMSLDFSGAATGVYTATVTQTLS